MKKALVASLLFLFIDQFTKKLVVNFFAVNSGIVIVPSFFSILHVKNYGAAFSMMQNLSYLLIFVSIGAIVFVYFHFLKNKLFITKHSLLVALLLGGIAGNLADRITRGYVVDFFAFELFGYPLPIFNFADIFIVCSALYMLIFVDWRDFDEDNSNR